MSPLLTFELSCLSQTYNHLGRNPNFVHPSLFYERHGVSSCGVLKLFSIPPVRRHPLHFKTGFNSADSQFRPRRNPFPLRADSNWTDPMHHLTLPLTGRFATNHILRMLWFGRSFQAWQYSFSRIMMDYMKIKMTVMMKRYWQKMWGLSCQWERWVWPWPNQQEAQTQLNTQHYLTLLNTTQHYWNTTQTLLKHNSTLLNPTLKLDFYSSTFRC